MFAHIQDELLDRMIKAIDEAVDLGRKPLGQSTEQERDDYSRFMLRRMSEPELFDVRRYIESFRERGLGDGRPIVPTA